MSLRDRHIVLGISGGIAAYKSVELARLLVRRGAQVQVVMSDAATRFVAPLSFEAVTGRAVELSLLPDRGGAAMAHIELARWAERILVAPASADFMARLVAGMADDLLTAVCLATTAPVMLAPAMNQNMWNKPATQRNAGQLQRDGIELLGPDSGEQACGDVGPGRMLEPASLLAALEAGFCSSALAGKRVLVTAGPTREPLDPVRYLSNRSSGKMGFALASAFRQAGAEVVLVTGPVSLATPWGVKRLDVETASQMREAVFSEIEAVDILAACAAVADYRPVRRSKRKLKKGVMAVSLELELNPDIVAEVAALERRPFILAFAAETHDVEKYAREKMERKGIDMLAANQVGAGLGFEVDENELLVLWQGGQERLAMQRKSDLAQKLVSLVAAHQSVRLQG